MNLLLYAMGSFRAKIESSKGTQVIQGNTLQKFIYPQMSLNYHTCSDEWY